MKPAAFVTGAANRIGREIAVHLANRGFNLWIHCQSRNSEIEQLRDQLRTADNQVEITEADIRVPEQIAEAFRPVREEGNLALLVNSAAVFRKTRLDTTDVSEWDDVMNINLRAAWLCAREAAGIMSARSESSLIVNIADSGAYQHWTQYGVYGLSKAALIELSVLLAKTYAPKIRVNSISPGLILKDESTPPQVWQSLAQKSLMKTSGSPESILASIDFLWDNPYITGVDIPVDGGYRWA